MLRALALVRYAAARDLDQTETEVESHAEGEYEERDVAAEEHAQLGGRERRLGVGVREDGVEHWREGRGCRRAVRHQEG